MKVSGSITVAAGSSTLRDTLAAVDEALAPIVAKLGANADVALVFVTPDHAPRAQELLDRVHEALAPDTVAGSTASGIVGGGHERQTGPGVSIWAARIPGARVQAFHLELEAREEGGVVRGWRDVGAEASCVLLVDPFSFPLDPFLASLRKQGKLPGIVGGLASGAVRPGDNRLFVDEQVHEEGAAGIVMDGAARFLPVLSQGCRPVGEPLVVTRSDRQVIYELNGEPAYERLGAAMKGLESEARRRFAEAPQIGLRVTPQGGGHDGGGYLIRGLVGADARSGALAVGDSVHDGLELRFHSRDARTAHAELEGLLELVSALEQEPAGALLFTCTGRGTHLFDQPDHDAGMVQHFYPGLPVAGMFAGGEIGPICGQPFLHGFSASMAFLVANPTPE
ncbi:MAG TPA: FIST N-terminal domain-containing protein [Planctomycetota bacterium]